MPSRARSLYAMDAFADTLQRFWMDMVGRTDGPMMFRFFLQPTVAFIMALRDGVKDAKAGREPYWVYLRNADPVARKEAWREGVRAVTRILLLGIAMDVIYQFRVFGGYRYPLETLFVALLLAFVPYLLMRGPITRVAARWMKRDKGTTHGR